MDGGVKPGHDELRGIARKADHQKNPPHFLVISHRCG
jgi:hypothetical protein